MSSRWPRWQLGGGSLTPYVQPDEVGRLLQLPGRSGESRPTRLRAVWAALAQRKIGYAWEDASDETGRQVIRPPDQVLWAPRHATCLDLALVLAGGCIVAGLHPVVVVVAPGGGPGALHAVVMVRMDADLEPGDGTGLWREQPAGLAGSIQSDLDGAPRRYVVVDPVGLAVSLGATSTRGLDVDLPTAIRNGAAYLAGAQGWTWRLGVDIGRTWRRTDALPVADRPDREPLRAPYRAVETAQSPLRLLRAEYGLVPFAARDELMVLRDHCRKTACGSATGIVVITGSGGAGKTRLGLELAQRLRGEGWYAGTLPKNASGVAWLAEVVSPVLVVLDYADGRVDDAIALFSALRHRVGPPAVVVLTARGVDGQWLHDIVEALDSDRHPYRSERIALPDAHPDAGDVYQRTVDALATGVVQPPRIPQGIRWTTLDFVLLGWIAAQGAATLPTTPGSLYEQVLEHEDNYWATVYRDNVRDRRPSRARLRAAAACLSLVAAPTDRTDTILEAVPDLRADARERHDVRAALISCLRPAAGEGLALRPDPVGDHLVLAELGSDEQLLHRAVDAAGVTGMEQAVITLVRAGQNDADTATRLISSLILADPDAAGDTPRWRAVLATAMAQGGAAALSLEDLIVHHDPSPLPLDQ
ncbi:MAG: hypothetical protein L0K86_00360, partial [Actinomycetia bacterium]|nr:hypothetical protein [Actinomycetes bacterium]